MLASSQIPPAVCEPSALAMLRARPNFVISNKESTSQGGGFFIGLPERIRTFDLQSRSLTRYPAVPRVDMKLWDLCGSSNLRLHRRIVVVRRRRLPPSTPCFGRFRFAQNNPQGYFVARYLQSRGSTRNTLVPRVDLILIPAARHPKDPCNIGIISYFGSDCKRFLAIFSSRWKNRKSFRSFKNGIDFSHRPWYNEL